MLFLDKAELFEIHLYETFEPYHDIYLPQHINEVDIFWNIRSFPNPPEKLFTPNEIKQTIQQYILKKTPDYDLFTAEVVRYLLIKLQLYCYLIYLTQYTEYHIFQSYGNS